MPFDGDRDFHDSIKKHPNGTGTYDTVLQNVKYAASKGFAFTIRCNYTDKNILSFKKAIDDLSNIDSKENLVFSTVTLLLTIFKENLSWMRWSLRHRVSRKKILMYPL